MNRNNLLMYSYIAFISICAVVRCFTEYRLWPGLLSGVTIASSIFSIGDLLFLIHQLLNDLCSPMMHKFKEYHTKFENSLGLLYDKKDSLATVLTTNPASADLNSLSEYLDDEIVSTIDTIDLCNRIVDVFALVIKKANKYKTASIFITSFGFLSFMCVLTFEPMAHIVREYQDILSVMAFALILFTNSLAYTCSSKIKEYLDSFGAETLLDRIHNESIKLCELISGIENHEESTQLVSPQ